MSCPGQPRRRKPFKDDDVLRHHPSIPTRIEVELRGRPLGELTFADFERLSLARELEREPLLLVEPA
jgi:hypothetical protein